MLYEVAILELPMKNKEGNWEPEKLVLKPTTVIAKDSQGAAIEAVLANTDALKDTDRSRMSVLVRPFAG